MVNKTLEELKVIISAETSKFKNALKDATNEARNSANSVENSTSRMGKAVSGIKGLVAKAAAGFGLYKLGKEAIEVASNITEVQNVVDTAFGDMSWKAERFAKNSIQQFGMSELSAKKTASTYMAMASGMGLSSDKASDMAISLAGLSGDVASFYNISQELADIKLKSVFTGETETLKDLGIVMTQTNLKQFALSQGIKTNIDDMNQAQLTTLRYNFVMQQLQMVQGDFAKTSGTWANQVRILQEQFKQLLGIIGNGLIAALTPAIQVINFVIGKLITLANVVAGVFSKLFGKKSSKDSGMSAVASDSSKASKSIGNIGSGLDNSNKKAKNLSKTLNTMTAGIDELNSLNINDSSGDSGSGSSGAGAGTGGGYDVGSIDWGNQFEEPDTSGVDKAVDKVIKKLNQLKKWFEQNKPIILSLIAGIVAGFLTFETIMNWGKIATVIFSLIRPFQQLWAAVSNWGVLSVLQGVFGTTAGMATLVSLAVAAVTAALVYLYQTSQSFRDLVNTAVSGLMGVLNQLYTTVLKPLFLFLADVFTTIITPIASFIAKVFVKAVEAISRVVLSIWNNVLVPLASFLVDILAIALEGLLEIWETWKPGIKAIGEAINWVWDNVLSPIVDFIVGSFSDTFKSWGDLIKKLIPDVENIFRGLIDFFVGVFTGSNDRAWAGIRRIFEGFSSFLKNVFSTDWTNAFGLLGVPLNYFCSTVSSIWETIKGVLSGVISFVRGVFTGNWKEAWNGVKKVFSSIVGGIAGIFKSPINAIIDGINSFIGGINKIKIPDWVPGVGGKGFSISKIPRLANGGIAYGNSLVNVGEYANARSNPEVIAPLSKLKSLLPQNQSSEDEIELMREQNELLRALLNKDSDVYLDGQKVTDEVNKVNKQKGFDFGFSY